MGKLEFELETYEGKDIILAFPLPSSIAFLPPLILHSPGAAQKTSPLTPYALTIKKELGEGAKNALASMFWRPPPRTQWDNLWASIFILYTPGVHVVQQRPLGIS